jgi:ethanolamine utilization protein EutQ
LKGGGTVKRLITVREVKECKNSGKNIIFVDKGTIITPAAIDAATEINVDFIEGSEMEKVNEKTDSNPTNEKNIDMDMIYKIVKEVMAQSMLTASVKSFDKECDPSGLKLIRGNTVECERFETGNPNSKVGLKDIVNTKESPNMGAGFMTIEKSSFDWELCYEEFDYIVEGNLDITIDGKTYHGKAGDVFFIPKNSKITWSTPDFARFFYVTYPANWAELAANK